jgi:hypothetical protein
MPVYVITGKLGAGKSLGAVARIQHYLWQGRKVATNLNLNPEHLLDYWKRNTEIYRIPNKPTVHDLDALPMGHDEDGPNDSRNGALVLDECGTWFNSRSWNDKDRGALIEWCRNARKKRWDIFFIIQDVSVMDSQARESFAEHVVYCRRMDRFNIPFLKLPLPKAHLAVVKYGDGAFAPTVDRWWYFGKHLYNAYDTEQVFSANNEIQAISRMLPPYFTHGRYISKWEKLKDDIKNQNFGKRWPFLIGAALSAFAVNALVVFQPEEPRKGMFTCNQTYEKLYGSCSAEPVAPYEYYYPKPPEVEITVLKSKEKAEPKSEVRKTPEKDDQFYYSSSVVINGRGVEYYWVDSDNNVIDIGPYQVVDHIAECNLRVKVASGEIKQIGCLTFKRDEKNSLALNSN